MNDDTQLVSLTQLVTLYLKLEDTLYLTNQTVAVQVRVEKGLGGTFAHQDAVFKLGRVLTRLVNEEGT